MHRKALGRGLEALIPAVGAALDAPSAGLRELAVDDVGPNPFQPRSHFDEQGIEELATSIRSTGVLQPILVRRLDGGGYQLVAGERRLKAARVAGMARIPAVVRDVTEREMLELSLIENVQREDLSPIDEAKAYSTLVEKVGLTHDQISERVGKQRVTVTNSIRLLALPAEVQDMVSRGTLTSGHARALLGLESKGDQLVAARYVCAKGFSVRRTESYIRRKLRRQHKRPRTTRHNGLEEWENRLQQRFGTHVAITPARQGGKVEFEYYSQEDLERLLEAWGVLQLERRTDDA